MTTFNVSAMADGGSFVSGNNAALAWDILKATGSHRVPLRIDLAACPHLKPYAIACICAIGLLGRKSGVDVSMRLPVDEGCRDHLIRLQLPQWFKCGPLPSVVKRQTNLPLENVRWDNRHLAAERIIELLAPQAQLSPGVAPKMKECLDEIIMNALTHAESPIDSVVVGQAFPSRKAVEVSVLDLGQTIRGHLSKNTRYQYLAEDGAAIELATQDGITGTPDGQKNIRGGDNSGAGLAYARDYCERGGGELTILSGDNWRTYSPKSQPIRGNLRQRFQGCLVNIRYSTELDLNQEETVPIL